MTDPTPAGLTFVSNSGDCATPFPCDLGVLAFGAPPKTITTTYLVPPGYTTPNPIVETATVSSPVPDPAPDNNSATVMTPVDTNADVEVTKFVAPTSGILVGDTVTFTVVARNHGPNSATAVVITDILPAGLMLVSASPSQGTYVAATGEWVLPSLALDQEEELMLQTVVTLPGDITNLAVRTGGNEPDPNPGNDSGAATINAAPAADVALQKTVDRPQPSVGETVTFTVTATNRGPSAATGVLVEDTLPAGAHAGDGDALAGNHLRRRNRRVDDRGSRALGVGDADAGRVGEHDGRARQRSEEDGAERGRPEPAQRRGGSVDQRHRDGGHRDRQGDQHARRRPSAGT